MRRAHKNVFVHHKSLRVSLNRNSKPIATVARRPTSLKFGMIFQKSDTSLIVQYQPQILPVWERRGMHIGYWWESQKEREN
jgi:hypothetical protein